MYLIKKIFEALDKAPWLWIYDSMLLGFGLASRFGPGALPSMQCWACL